MNEPKDSSDAVIHFDIELSIQMLIIDTFS